MAVSRGFGDFSCVVSFLEGVDGVVDAGLLEVVDFIETFLSVVD
jgi:hypothetical protein